MSEVTIDLNGRRETLRCTLRAARAVSAAFGSFGEAYRRIGASDFNAYEAIVAAGLGRTSDDVGEAVFRTGLAPLAEPLSRYVAMLMNGGREPGTGPKEGEGTGEH